MTEAIGTARWIVIDTVDPEPLVTFWCALLGVERAGTFLDDYVMLTDAGGTVPPVSFQRVPEPKTVKNRIHLDVHVGDLDEAIAKVEAIGGTRVGGFREQDGYRWHVMADPEGNEFCLIPD